MRDRNYPLNPKVKKRYDEAAEKAGRGPYYGAWRIEEHYPANASDGRFLNVLTATSTDSARPVKAKLVRDGSRDGVVLTLKGKKMTFWFNREGEVGGVVELGKTTRPLTDKVQPQSGIIFE